MQLYTTQTVSGAVVKHLELVTGSVAYSFSIRAGMNMGLQSFNKGVLTDFEKHIDIAKEAAKTRFVIAAKNVGADAIVDVRCNVSFHEVFIYVEYNGTAVTLNK